MVLLHGYSCSAQSWIKMLSRAEADSGGSWTGISIKISRCVYPLFPVWQLQIGLKDGSWKQAPSGHWSFTEVFRGVFPGVTWGSLTSWGNTLLLVSLFDSRQWRCPRGGQPRSLLGYIQGIDGSAPGGPVTSASKPVKSSSGSLSQPFTSTDIEWHLSFVIMCACVCARAWDCTEAEMTIPAKPCLFIRGQRYDSKLG